MNIAIIGCGEVGCMYAAAFANAGQALTLCAPRPTEKVQQLVNQYQLPLHLQLGEWLSQIDIVICCTPNTAALTVAQEALPFLKSGVVFADFSSAAAERKREAAALAQANEILFVDVVIMGSVDAGGIATPLLCAGKGSEVVAALMRTVNAPIKVLANGKVGEAAALKLLRSAFTKGLMALTVECVVAAESQGVKAVFYELLSDLDKNPFTELLDRLLRSHVVHACRQRQEVADAAAQFRDFGLSTQLLSAVEAVFASTCERIKFQPTPSKNPSTEEALTWLLKNNSFHLT